MWEDMLLLLYAVRFYRERLGTAGLRITVYDNESKDGSVELARALGCHVVSFSSEGTLSDSKYVEVKSNCWKKSEADWVVIVDLDEWLDIRPTDLDDYEGRNVTCVKAEPSILIWKNDTNDLTEPPYSTPLTAFEEEWYAKPCLFDRRKITEYALNPGGHTLAKQEGQINWLHDVFSPVASPRLYHVKFFDEKYLLNRYEKYNQRMSEENQRRGWATHYYVHEVAKMFEERRKKLEPVPGLKEGGSIFQIEEGLREATAVGNQGSITPASAEAAPKLTPWHDQEDELYPLHLFEVNYSSSQSLLWVSPNPQTNKETCVATDAQTHTISLTHTNTLTHNLFLLGDVRPFEEGKSEHYYYVPFLRNDSSRRIGHGQRQQTR
jgi:hypothetical protein